MDNVKRYSSFIKRIVTAPEPLRVKLLKSSNLKIIKAVCELLLNIVQKNITVKKIVLARLKNQKNLLSNYLNLGVLKQGRLVLLVIQK